MTEQVTGDQIRYSYDNLTGSSGLELDGDGKIISMEESYPYGGTAVWTARSAVEADYKTIRYSGKERDATGLYYYGYRYYQPWAGRWLSSDPAGTVDGLNLFRMVRNNPVTLRDNDGRNPTSPTEFIIQTEFPVSTSAGGSFKIQRWGDDREFRAVATAFSDMFSMTNVPEMDMTSYVKSFEQLSGFEKISLRLWTGVNSAHEYHDVMNDKDFGTAINYGINLRLARGIPLPSREQAVYDNIKSALYKLPKYPATLLRTVEHSPQSPSPWAKNIYINDIVTNDDLIMSASEYNQYAFQLTNKPALPETNEIVHYLIESESAYPLVWNIASPSRNEYEWIFSPHTHFAVKEIVQATSTGTQRGSFPESANRRTGVVLKEIASHPVERKNIFSGTTMPIRNN